MKIKIDVNDEKDVFFISDLHLFHKNVIKFDNRPFYDAYGYPDVNAMHKTIIKNWNDTVRDTDTVFCLGDFCFGKWEWAKSIVDVLNGKIHFIMGNHDDYKHIKKIGRFESINDYVDLNLNGDKDIKNLHFVLMHYPILSWNRQSHGSYMIHGHTHMSLSYKDFHKNKRIFDVGCNGWNYTPVSYGELIKLGENIDFKS